MHRCSECGGGSPRWLGRCPECGSWGTIVEERAPSGFTNLDDVISQDELAEVSRSYQRIAGFEPTTLNNRPPWSAKDNHSR